MQGWDGLITSWYNSLAATGIQGASPSQFDLTDGTPNTVFAKGKAAQRRFGQQVV